ncbi:MAG: hypothetical protein K2Q97_12385, partial [Burkholderiaceae bacterium]|nr:hypothetical protein [Burkholderiaceae bacterium]
LQHARELGFDATRHGFHRAAASVARPRPPAPSSVAAARSAPPVASARDRTAVTHPAPVVHQRKPPTAPAFTVRFAEPTAAHLAWRAIMHLRPLPPERRPTQAAAWQALVESLIHEPVADKAGLAQRAAQLVQERPWGVARAPWSVPGSSARLSSAHPAATAKVSSPLRAVHSAARAAQLPPAPQKPPAPSLAATVPSAKVTQEIAKAPAKVPAKAPIATPVKTPPALTPAQLVLRVLASLQKMLHNKPTRRAGLLKHIENHTAAAHNKAVLVGAAFALLQKQRHVLLSEDGLRVSYAAPKAAAKIPAKRKDKSMTKGRVIPQAPGKVTTKATTKATIKPTANAPDKAPAQVAARPRSTPEKSKP